MAAGEPLPPESELAETLAVSRTTVRAAVKVVEEEGLVRTADNRRRIVIGGTASSDSLLSETIAIITHLEEAWPSGVRHPVATGWERYVQLSLIEAIRTARMHALTLHLDRLRGEQVNKLLSNRPRGLVLMRPASLSSEIFPVAEKLRQSGTPVVCYGYGGSLQFDSLTSDHAAGCQELCRWLIRNGRRRLLRVWDGAIGAQIPEWRRQRDLGYEAAMHEAGLEILPLVGIPNPPEAAIQNRQEFEMRARLTLGYLWEHLSGPEPVDAILALTDGLCYPIAAACRMIGKEPNRDVAIVGYDNYWQDSPHRRWEPVGPAATIDKLNVDLGQKLMELLLARAGGELPPEPQLRLISPELKVVSESQFTHNGA